MSDQRDEHDDDDQAIDASPDEAREAFQHKVKTEGLEVAYATAINICKDSKAPAPARATMAVALMRAAGAFARADEETDVEPHNMTAAQLEREIARIRRQDKGPRPARAAKSGDGVFE